MCFYSLSVCACLDLNNFYAWIKSNQDHGIKDTKIKCLAVDICLYSNSQGELTA
jgi:hypothetical protein